MYTHMRAQSRKTRTYHKAQAVHWLLRSQRHAGPVLAHVRTHARAHTGHRRRVRLCPIRGPGTSGPLWLSEWAHQWAGSTLFLSPRQVQSGDSEVVAQALVEGALTLAECSSGPAFSKAEWRPLVLAGIGFRVWGCDGGPLWLRAVSGAPPPPSIAQQRAAELSIQ